MRRKTECTLLKHCFMRRSLRKLFPKQSGYNEPSDLLSRKNTMRVGIKKSLCLLALMGLSQFSTGFAEEAASQPQIADDRITIEKVTEDVHIKMITSKGVIIAKLDFQNSPITVQNFVDYINAGFFDGLIFHRVSDGFMIQGGGFDETMSQKKALYPAIQ